jgi:hypothetical protein
MMGIARNAIVLRTTPALPPPQLTPEELAIIQARLHLQIYEPVCANNEILFADNGDVVMSWGGLYVA